MLGDQSKDIWTKKEDAQSVSPLVKSSVEKNFSRYLKEKAQKFPTITQEPKLHSNVRTRTPPPSIPHGNNSSYSIYDYSSVVKKPTKNKKIDIDKWASPLGPAISEISLTSIGRVLPQNLHFNTASKNLIKSRPSKVSFFSAHSASRTGLKHPKEPQVPQFSQGPFLKETTMAQVMQLGLKRGAYGARLLMMNRRFCLYDMAQCFGRWRLFLSESSHKIVEEKPILFQMSPEIIEKLIKGLNVILKFHSQRVTSHFLKWKHLIMLNFPFYFEEEKILVSEYFYKMVNAERKLYLNSLYKRMNMKSMLDLAKGGTLIKGNSYLNQLEKEKEARKNSSQWEHPSIPKKTEHIRVHFVDLYRRLEKGIELAGRKPRGEAQTVFLHLKAISMVSRMVMASKKKLKLVHKMKVTNDMKKVLVNVIRKRFLVMKATLGYMATEERARSIKKNEVRKENMRKFPDRFYKALRYFRSYYLQRRFYRWRIYANFCSQLEPVKALLVSAINVSNLSTANIQELIQAERKKAPEIFKYRCFMLLGSSNDLRLGRKEVKSRKNQAVLEPPLSEGLENKLVLLIKERGQQIMDETSIELMKVLIKRRADPESLIKKEMSGILHNGVISIISMIISSDSRHSFHL